MAPPSTTNTRDLAVELHALLIETDPVGWTADVADRSRVRLASIRSHMKRLPPRAEPATPSKLDAAVAHLAQVVRESPAEPETRAYWMQLRARLMPAYERLAVALHAENLAAPTLRPTNWTRIAFHVSAALGSLLLLEVILSHRGTLWATGLFAGTCWLLETTRALSARWNDVLMRVRFFKLIIHPHEHYRVNSSTWYGTALFLLALFSPALASAAALGVLGLGDPLAGIVGRRWGRTPVGGGRTLEGSLAFVVGGTAAALAVLSLWHPVAAWPMLLAVSGAAAIAGAAAEALSVRIDDNFSVPIAAAAGAWLTAAVLGVAL